MAYDLRRVGADNEKGMGVDIEIFFRSTESGNAWYVWLRAASQAYFFSSLDNARRFAAPLARARHPTGGTETHHCLEQAATLI